MSLNRFLKTLFAAAVILASGFELAVAQGEIDAEPRLQVTRQGDTLSFCLAGCPVNSGEIWVLQSSLNLGDWDDLLVLDDSGQAQLSISQQDRWGRLFRARRLEADNPALREFLTARSIWRSVEIDDYTMEINHQFSQFFWHGTVTVQNRQVTSAVPIESHHFGDYNARTIDEWFAHLNWFIDQEADRIDVTYDAVFGYPKTVFVDYRFLIADEEEGWSILDFQPLP